MWCCVGVLRQEDTYIHVSVAYATPSFCNVSHFQTALKSSGVYSIPGSVHSRASVNTECDCLKLAELIPYCR